MPTADNVSIAALQVVEVAVSQITVREGGRSVDAGAVDELVESITKVGLLNPITVDRASENTFILVAGHHRLEAVKRLGRDTISAIVHTAMDDLRRELASIDENLIRRRLTPAEHAIQTTRRAEILRGLAVSTLSQAATASMQARRRGGEFTGPDPASVRDQARVTGESKDKVARSLQIGRKIPGLRRLVKTSLDKGSELDALRKFPPDKQEQFVREAEQGKKVSARAALAEIHHDRLKEPARQRQKAITALEKWRRAHHAVVSDGAAAGLVEQLITVLRESPTDDPKSGTREE